jgi:hypothetical protein
VSRARHCLQNSKAKLVSAGIERLRCRLDTVTDERDHRDARCAGLREREERRGLHLDRQHAPVSPQPKLGSRLSIRRIRGPRWSSPNVSGHGGQFPHQNVYECRRWSIDRDGRWYVVQRCPFIPHGLVDDHDRRQRQRRGDATGRRNADDHLCASRRQLLGHQHRIRAANRAWHDAAAKTVERDDAQGYVKARP